MWWVLKPINSPVSVQERWDIVSDICEEFNLDDMRFEVTGHGLLLMELPGPVNNWRDYMMIADTPGMETQVVMDERHSMVWWALYPVSDDLPLTSAAIGDEVWYSGLRKGKGRRTRNRMTCEDLVIKMATEYLGLDHVEFDIEDSGMVWVGFMGNVRDWRSQLETWSTPHYVTQSVSSRRRVLTISFNS